MNHHTPKSALLAQLIAEQETDALDDGFPYERMGERDGTERPYNGWVTPTPFMLVALKELLRALVKVYGWQGHRLLQDIGHDNLRDMRFVDGLGLEMHCTLYNAALSALPEDEAKRLGFVE